MSKNSLTARYVGRPFERLINFLRTVLFPLLAVLYLFPAWWLLIDRMPGDLSRNMFAELFGATLVFVVTWLSLFVFRYTRRKAFRNTVFQNAVRLVAFCNDLSTHYPTRARKEADENRLRRKHYVGLIRTIIWANESAKRAIDLNDTVASDTFLRLEDFKIKCIFENTMDAYELTSSFEYLLERLGNRDLFRPGYEQYDADNASSVFLSVMQDFEHTNFSKDLERYRASLMEVLRQLGGDEKKIEAGLDRIVHLNEDGIPQVDTSDIPYLASYRALIGRGLPVSI